MSDSLPPHGLQHARLPCTSLSPGVCSNSCALSRWCHPTISSSVTLFSSFPLSSPASKSFPVSHIRWPKYWSFSFSIRPSNEYSGPISFRMDWFDLLAVQGTLKSLLQQHSLKALNKSKMVRVNKTLLVDSMFTRSLIKCKLSSEEKWLCALVTTHFSYLLGMRRREKRRTKSVTNNEMVAILSSKLNDL